MYIISFILYLYIVSLIYDLINLQRAIGKKTQYPNIHLSGGPKMKQLFVIRRTSLVLKLLKDDIPPYITISYKYF